MTHFPARFPQHSHPIANPSPADYRDAVAFLRAHLDDRHEYYQQPELARIEKFARVLRRLGWAPVVHDWQGREVI